jgi:hypothetical protein
MPLQASLENRSRYRPPLASVPQFQVMFARHHFQMLEYQARAFYARAPFPTMQVLLGSCFYTSSTFSNYAGAAWQGSELELPNFKLVAC